jgi:HAD superfamily hydrolase (TIGR01509 family)
MTGTTAAATGGVPVPRGVIFDLDGTLTEPLLDFEAIRREVGIASGLPILEALESFDAEARARAEVILRRHEMDAIRAATLADGCSELLAQLAQRGIPVAILTRNVRDAVEDFVRRFEVRVTAAFTREDGPPKPSPAGVLSLCRTFGLPPADVWMVGDYKYDVIAGRDAGCRTALVLSPVPPDLDDWGGPDLAVPSLRALAAAWWNASADPSAG